VTTILVVEDDDNLRRLYRLLLGAQGYKVAEAPDGAAGLQMALGVSPACIVTDSMMPAMDGLEMLLHLRRQRPDRTPAIFVTAVTHTPTLEQQEAAGIVAVIHKPFDFDAMIAVVRRWAGEPSE